MKTTILGIEVGRFVMWRFREYIRAVKDDEEDNDHMSGWSRGYNYALAICSVREAMEKKTITREQKSILETFLGNIENRGYRDKLYRNWT